MASKVVVASIALLLVSLPFLPSASGQGQLAGGGGQGQLARAQPLLARGNNGNSNVLNLPPFLVPNAATFFAGSNNRCNTLNLGLCLNVLNGLVNVEVGDVPTKPCCSVIQGLLDLEAAVCLCTTVRASVLNLVNVNLPINLSLLLNNCGGRQRPAFQYQCRR